MNSQDQDKEFNINLDEVLEGEESVFDQAEKRLRAMLDSEDEKVQLKAIGLAPRFESMRPQKKNIVLSEEMRFLIEVLLHIEQRFQCSAMTALGVLKRSMADFDVALSNHSPKFSHKKQKNNKRSKE